MSCKYCKNAFDEPKFLPCGATICNRCIQVNIISTAADSSTSYKCLMCEDTHEFPANNSFKTNIQLMELLNLKTNKTESDLKLKQTIECECEHVNL